VIVDVVDIVGVTLLETKDDAPVRPDSNGPEASKIASQGVQSEAGQVHVFGLPGSIEDREDILYFLSVIGADPFGFLEASNHGLCFTLS